MRVKVLEYGSSQEAWEGINEYFLTEEETILKYGGKRPGSQLIAYDTLVRIRNSWVDPKFDFGKMFNYHPHKWNRLISNYMDMNVLDLVKAEVQSRERKKSSSYNVAFLFSNAHASGKGCLLSCTFTRRSGEPNPILIINLRSSEIVKRLIFDFLLIQRIGEYVYGDRNISLQIFFPNMYTNSETSIMYDIHKPILKLEGFTGELPFQKSVIDKMEEFKLIDPEKIKYGIHRRAARVIQGTGKAPALLAEMCNLK